MPVVHVNDIDVYYEHQGHGPRVLFLNGSGATLAPTLPLLRPLTEHVELLIHDQRGLGRTSIPPGPYSMADYAADALALLDAVGWPTAEIVGVSFGGMVAQELAVTAPQRAERLALLCTSPGGAGGSSYPLHELEALPAEEQASRRVQLLDTRFDDEWLATHERDRALVEAMAARAMELDAEHRRGVSEQLAARRGHDVWDRLHVIGCPTLVACGRYDGIAPPENGAAIASRMSGADLRSYEGGHAFLVQDTSAVRDLIEFLT